MWTPSSVVWIYTTIELKKQEKLKAITASIHPSKDNTSVQYHNEISSVNLISGLPSLSSSSPSVTTNKNAHNLNSIISTPMTQDPAKKKVAADKQHICFYGHTTTSAYRRGKPTWHVSPIPPWPSVPPDRPLCQKCYQVHRTAALKGKSQ